MPDNKEIKYKMKPSNIEEIDNAVYFYVNETLNLHTNTNKGFTKTPVLWVGAERSFQIKGDIDLRNKDEVYYKYKEIYLKHGKIRQVVLCY